MQRIRFAQAQHLAGVIFAEIDGFADVGLSLGPRFAGFVDQPGVELHLAIPQDPGGVAKHADTGGSRCAAPLGEE